jgi:hypothetical protein
MDIDPNLQVGILFGYPPFFMIIVADFPDPANSPHLIQVGGQSTSKYSPVKCKTEVLQSYREKLDHVNN